jgi:hypothetical protein
MSARMARHTGCRGNHSQGHEYECREGSGVKRRGDGMTSCWGWRFHLRRGMRRLGLEPMAWQRIPG